jgi:carbon monoxide dehydrogenase subunit G
MFTVERTITIRRPLADVFAFLADHTNDPRWRSDLIATRWTSTGVTGVGATFQATVKFLGRQTSDYRASLYKPDVCEAFVATSGPLRTSRIAYEVSPDDQGTLLHYQLDVQLNGLFRLTEPIMPRLFQKQLEQFLAKLKLVLETDPAVPIAS